VSFCVKQSVLCFTLVCCVLCEYMKITPGITLTWLATLDAGKSLEDYL